MAAITGIGGARIAGLVAGVAAVAIVTAATWRVPSDPTPLGLDVELRALPSGALSLVGTGRMVRAHGVRPGDAAMTGRVRFRNDTGVTLAVRPRFRPGPRALSEAMRVQIARGSRTIFDGTAADLRRPGRVRTVVWSGATATMTVRAWLPHGSEPAPLGGGARWLMELVSQPYDGVAGARRRRRAAA